MALNKGLFHFPVLTIGCASAFSPMRYEKKELQ